MTEKGVWWVSPQPTLSSRFFGHAYGQEALQPPLGLCQFSEVHWHL